MAARRTSRLHGGLCLLQSGVAHPVSRRDFHRPREVANSRRRGGVQMRVEIFVDEEQAARGAFEPPGQLELDTSNLTDGPHVLRVRASEGDGAAGNQEIPFVVRNGPGIAVVGLRKQEVVHGRVPILVNAYESRLGEVFAGVSARPGANTSPRRLSYAFTRIGTRPWTTSCLRKPTTAMPGPFRTTKGISWFPAAPSPSDARTRSTCGPSVRLLVSSSSWPGGSKAPRAACSSSTKISTLICAPPRRREFATSRGRWKSRRDTGCATPLCRRHSPPCRRLVRRAAIR